MYSKANSDEKTQFVSDRGRILIDNEYTTPEKILKEHPFFDKMRPQEFKIVKK